MIASAGEFVLPRWVRVAIAGDPPVDGRVTHLLVRELRRWYDMGVDVVPATAGAHIVLFKHRQGATIPADLTVPSLLAARLDSLPAQGYVEIVTPTQAVVFAPDDAGLYYGVQTWLQNVELTTARPDSPRARCGTVVDWPSLPWRALSMSIPTSRWGHPNDAPVDVGFFCDFIERFVARRKFNALVFLTREGICYDSHPEISGPAAWSKAAVRRVVETCRAHFIEPIPLVDSYGHAEWLTLPHKELWEDGDHHIACSSNPETFKILTDVYAELLEVFAPVRYFHLGLDEVWWKTLDVPPEQRCPRCVGVPKWQLFAAQVSRLHDWLQARGVRAMMWSDVLLPEHNGGAPYHGAKALPLIPYVNNIKRWEIGERMPYVFGAVGFLCAATERMRQQNPHGRDLCLYVAQWVNPHPEKVIQSVAVSGCAAAVPVVFAITGTEVKQTAAVGEK